MRGRLYLAGVALGAAGLVVCLKLFPARSTPAAFEKPREDREYFAEYSGVCGLTLVKIAREQTGPLEIVYPTGTQAPDAQLRMHAWRARRFLVRGRMTGK